MKNTNWILLILIVMTAGCNKDLQFDDPRTLTLDEAAEVKGAFLKFVNSATLRSLNQIHSGEFGVQFLALADQISTTNRFNEFWDFAQEPRKSLNNSQSYNGYGVIRDPWANFNQANLDANQVIFSAKAGTKLLDAQGRDRTSDALAVAYFAKGISQAYLGALYDRGIIVDQPSQEVTITNDYPNSYKEMVENGIKQIDLAIATANGASTFNFDFLPGQTNITKDVFIKLCNSMAARLMASIPRDLTEAKALGAAFWNKVYTYANAGITTDLINLYATDGFYNGTVDWSISLLGDGAGYLPVDIKVAWLANNSHPKYYPATGILPPVETPDKRFYQYFGYDPDFGFLRSDRNRGLFTNYYRKRWDNAGNTVAEPGEPSPIFMAEEIRLLKAEAKMFAGDVTAAAALLNEPSAARIAKGTLAPVAATEDAVRYALHYEYSIEIDNGGGILPPWAFMRRNNLLIGGTPTQLPVPEVQMAVIKGTPYTFGGKANAGQKGKWGEVHTAADNGWKKSE